MTTMMIDARTLRAALWCAVAVSVGLYATAALAASTSVTPAPSAANDEPVTFSDAETRLWLTDQLRSITQPATLEYEFVKTGSFEQGFTDTVRFTVSKINADGSKAAALEFFTGERHFPVPPVDNATTNPVLKVYMQGDVYEMNRLTDPDGAARERWRYFQRRIKFALAESATVTPSTFEFDGRQWQGHVITFAPFVNDPRRDQFERFADKHYAVTVSDDLPGYVYRIEVVIPGEANAAEPLIREVLQLRAIEPAS
jgi:hypothetical protein